MNVERIRELADRVEAAPSVSPEQLQRRMDAGLGLPTELTPPEPTEFCMRHFRCGTTACIGGWAETLFGDQKSLGLSPYEYEQLYYARGFEDYSPFDATAERAALVLRHLAETGLVDWTIGAPGEAE